jgi:hypothetical protein
VRSSKRRIIPFPRRGSKFPAWDLDGTSDI